MRHSVSLLFLLALPLLAPAQNAAEIQTRHNQALLKEISAYITANPQAEDLDAAYNTALQTAYILEDKTLMVDLLQGHLRLKKAAGTVDVREVAQMAMLLGNLAKQEGKTAVLDETIALVKELAVTYPEGLMTEVSKELEALKNKLGLGDTPELKGVTTDGKEINLADYRGKVVMLDFWATWCPPCLAEIPKMKILYAKYHDKGFEIIGVSGDRARKPLTDFIEREKIAWPSLYDKDQADSLLQAFRIEAFPTIYLLDQEGKIVGMDLRGEELAKEVARLLEGK